MYNEWMCLWLMCTIADIYTRSKRTSHSINITYNYYIINDGSFTQIRNIIKLYNYTDSLKTLNV